MASEPVRPENSKRSLSMRVSKLIRIQLERGKVGVETVAGQLNMSRYTLHKKLRQEGLTFAALLEQVRREQAITYMKDKSKPLVEIAEQLGFSELSPPAGRSSAGWERRRLNTALFGCPIRPS